MSEYQISLHIQEEIMKWLPVKSLIRFRRVSKAWKSLIDSSEFIAAHSLTQPQHLLVSYEVWLQEEKYVCYIDDDTFTQQRSVVNLPLPLSVKQLHLPRVVGSSRGLVCWYGYDPIRKTGMTVVWNPCIRKYVVIAVPKRDGITFGVCPVTNDPKILSITHSSWHVPEASYKCEVMVYTLSSGKWRSLSTNFPTKRLLALWSTVATDRFIYWLAESRTHNFVMSFDVTNETFEVIDLPNTLARHDPVFLDITKLRESLVILEYTGDICTVWMMEHGVQRSFIKLFIITTPLYSIVGFTKNGMPIMRVIDDDYDDDGYYHEQVKLVVYEPTSEPNNVLEMCTFDSFDVNAYMETLLLLGRSDCISY